MTREDATAIAPGQWFDTAGEARWWFDAGSVALDFANTGALPDNTERFQTPSDVGTWLHDRLHSVDPQVTERELSDALGLRAAIASLSLSTLRGHFLDTADIDVLNLFAAMPDVPPVLAGGSRQAGASRLRVQHALSSVAREAIRILRDETPTSAATSRIRQCAADDCNLVYLDTSRSGNRRWCSMQRCGNRAKVRAHRARTGSKSLESGE